MKNDNWRDNLIDITKFLAAILVVMLHTGLLSDSTRFVWQFDVILRLAVPFFIICSGYYLGRQGEIINRRIVSNVHNQKMFFFMKKIGRVYIVWSVVYLIFAIPKWIETGWFSVAAFIDWALSFFIRGSYYHLWYLLFLVYAAFILQIIGNRISCKSFLFLSIVLYLIEVIQYGYRTFLPESLQNILIIFDKFPCISAITRVLPFLVMGIYISSSKRKSSRYYLFGLVFSLLIVIVERNFLLLNNQTDVSYILGMMPASYFLFQLIINYRNVLPTQNFAILSKISTYIYLIHPLFISIIGTILSDKLQVFVGVTISSIISSVLFIKFEKVIGR